MNINASRSTRFKYVSLGIGLVIIASLFYFLHAGKSATDSESDSVKAGPAVVEIVRAAMHSIDTTVTAQGTLTASQGGSARIAPVNPGRLVSVRVREGDTVHAGEVVAVLDSRVPQAQAASAASALKVSQIQAQQASLAAKAAATDHANAVETARLDLETAQTELKKLEAGARPQEIAQSDQSVKQAQATRDRAASEVERVQFLFDKGIDSKRQVEDAKTALLVADSSLATAKAQASLIKEGARPEDLHTAKLRVKAAQAALRQAQQGSLQVQAKLQDTQAAVESIRQKNADLAVAQMNVAYTELRSPISGKVTHRLLNPGDMADTTNPVVEIADTHSLNLVANIPAEDGTAICVGMPARVTAANAPSRTFTGTVVNVGEVDPQSGMLVVRISVPSDGALKVGAFASADIITHTDRAAIVVPKSAVLSRDSHDVLFTVSKDNTAHQVNVKIGAQQGDMIEILSGIRPGDQVISLGQYELTDGAKIRPAKHSADTRQ